MLPWGHFLESAEPAPNRQSSFLGNSTSYLTPLRDSYRDGQGPPLRSALGFLQGWVGEETTPWQKPVTRRSVRQLCPKFSRGPEWKFHARNRNLPVKHCNKFKQTNKSSSLADVQKFSEHLQGKSGEARLAWVWCFCLNCQIILLFSPGDALGSLFKEPTNSLAQNSAGERTRYSSCFKCEQHLGKTALYCSDTEKMQKKGINPRVIPGLCHMSTGRALKHATHPFARGKPKPHTKTGS